MLPYINDKVYIFFKLTPTKARKTVKMRRITEKQGNREDNKVFWGERRWRLTLHWIVLKIKVVWKAKSLKRVPWTRNTGEETPNIELLLTTIKFIHPFYLNRHPPRIYVNCNCTWIESTLISSVRMLLLFFMKCKLKYRVYL